MYISASTVKTRLSSIYRKRRRLAAAGQSAGPVGSS